MKADGSDIAAHTYLDAVIAHQFEGDGSGMQLAVQKLTDSIAIRATKVGDEVRVDASGAVNGAIVPIYMLAYWLAEERGVSLEEVVHDLRVAYDELG